MLALKFIGLILIGVSFWAGIVYAGPIIVEDTITTFFREEDDDHETENGKS